MKDLGLKKPKHRIGKLVQISANGATPICEITSIEYTKDGIIYHLDNSESHCTEQDVIASYSLDSVRKKRTVKPKKTVDAGI